MPDFMTVNCIDDSAAGEFAEELLGDDIMVGEVTGRVVTIQIGSVAFIAHVGYRAMSGGYALEKDADTAVAAAVGETPPAR